MTFHKVIVPISQFLTKVKISTTIIYSYSNNHINNINVLCYDRVDVSEGMNINNTNKSKEFDIYSYWYFTEKGFKFQLHVCNVSHDTLM